MSPGLLGLLLIGASAVPLNGQAKTMLAEPPTPLLPESLRGGADHDAGNGAPAWSGAAQPVLVEDGIKRYERGTPASSSVRGTAPSGTVTVYQFVDATGAAAAYDYLRKSAPYVVRSGVSVVVSDVKLPPGVGRGAAANGGDGTAEGGWAEGIASAAADVSADEGLGEGLAALCAGAVGIPGDGWSVAAGGRWI